MADLTALDAVRLNFSPTSLTLLNAILAVIMYGVALDLAAADFRRVLRMPRAFAVGLAAQFVLLPATTWLLVMLVRPTPSVALGMLLVASCPGGTISNFLTSYARANTALSVSLSATSSLAAVVLTPLNVALWSGLYAPAARLWQDVAVEPSAVVAVVVLVLGLPLLAGIATRQRWPQLARCLYGPFRIASVVFFIGFVAVALRTNWTHFVAHVGDIAALVVAHNAMAFAAGYAMSTLAGLAQNDRRAVTLEVGIQNSGLGLVLIFDFFAGLGGMAIVAALWGIWHLVAGAVLAQLWRLRAPQLPTRSADPADL